MQRNLAGISVLQPPLVQAIFNRNAEEVQLLLHKQEEDVNALVCIMLGTSSYNANGVRIMKDLGPVIYIR